MASSSTALKTIVVIGGTGAQGTAVLRHLSALNQYRIFVLTRTLTSHPAKELSKLANVELVQSQAASGYDLDAFLTVAKQSDYAFVNTDGFAVGEIAETYWGIRLFEVARQAGIKHFVYSGLDYLAREPLYNADQHYVGHYMGKARVQGTFSHHLYSTFPLQLSHFQSINTKPSRIHALPIDVAYELDNYHLWPIH
jgi:hypothetical protein